MVWYLVFQGSTAVCNGVDSVVMAECRIAGGDGTLWSDMLEAMRNTLVDTFMCSDMGLWCRDVDNAPAVCQDYEVRYKCQGM